MPRTSAVTRSATVRLMGVVDQSDDLILGEAIAPAAAE